MQCPSRAYGLSCVVDTKARPDGKCPFCGGVVGRPTDGGDEQMPGRESGPSLGWCEPPAGKHYAMVYTLDGSGKHLCSSCLRELYRRG